MPPTERTPLLLDANVVIDLAKLGCLEQVARLPGLALLVVDEVVAEVKHPAQAAALQRAVDSGLIARVTLGDPAEQALMASLGLALGAGEAASLACAATRGHFLATDEKRPKLIREVRDRLGERRLVRSTTLLARAVTEHIVSLEGLNERLRQLSERASSPRDHDDAEHLERTLQAVTRALGKARPR